MDVATFHASRKFAEVKSGRIAHYERVYETVDDSDGSYIKIIDVGSKVVLNRIGSPRHAKLAADAIEAIGV